jgi:hypothetical protein
LPETKELELRWMEELLLGFESFPRRYYPDRVRGYLSAPHFRGAPLFQQSN